MTDRRILYKVYDFIGSCGPGIKLLAVCVCVNRF